MTKKKTSRPKHQKDVGDTSEEELKTPYQGKVCPHVQRAVNFARVRKALKLGNFNTCNGGSDCGGEELWLCLQCGHRGCGRSSDAAHALQHFRTLHSDCHALVHSLASGCVWCYDCDEEVRLQCSNVLRQCVEFVTKAKVNSSNKLHNVKAEKKPEQRSLIECVLKEQSAKPEALKRKEVKGLRNLGNTCFFNAVMQSLSATPLLLGEVESACTLGGVWEVPKLSVTEDDTIAPQADPLRLELSRESLLLSSFLKFLRQMAAPGEAVVNPSDLFNEIQKRSPQFQHYLQQDSHELLRQFLDHIRQEEVKRQKRAILKNFKIGNANQDISDHVRKLIKAYGSYASHTLVDRVFGGILISSVLCEECKTSSQIFEPFMDLSLPLFEEKQPDQLCSLLDGGKDSKASRKVCDDGEYVLSRPKQEKPSKHLEKKHKMMLKKQRKAQRKKSTKKDSLEEEKIEETNAEGDTIEETVGETDTIEETIGETDTIEETIGETDTIEETIGEADKVEETIGEADKVEEILVEGDTIEEKIEETTAEEEPCCNGDAEEEHVKALSADDESSDDDNKAEEEGVVVSLRPLQPRPVLPPNECSVRSCLSHFTRPELLTGANRFRCDNCTDIKRKATGDAKAVSYSNACKQLLVLSPPSVLTLHLKRFQQVGVNLRKVNRFVEFPLLLDLAPFCTRSAVSGPSCTSVPYSLYAVVEHSGRLTSGHYTAFVLRGESWFHVSDTVVRPASQEQVLRSQAYLLFYHRMPQ